MPLHVLLVQRTVVEMMRDTFYGFSLGGSPTTNHAWTDGSLQHLVNFLDNHNPHEVMITELELRGVRLFEPYDGGFNFLRDFFARSDTTLTKVVLHTCNFGNQEEASQLLAAFQTNTSVTDLTISHGMCNLEGAALGISLSGLIQNMPHLQRLKCYSCALGVEGVRVFQPALQANLKLRQLSLYCCGLGDGGIRLVADSLVGNTTMEILNISFNFITSLDDITRMIDSTRLGSAQ